MPKKTSRLTSAIICILLACGCSSNKFKNYGMWNSFTFFTFGMLGGHDDYKFCRKLVPNFIGKYQNNVNPTRTCIRYQYYTCHITHYCPQFKDEVERKKCEEDAGNYWLNPWRDAITKKLVDPIATTKRICERESRQCNSPSAQPNDQRCRR